MSARHWLSLHVAAPHHVRGLPSIWEQSPSAGPQPRGSEPAAPPRAPEDLEIPNFHKVRKTCKYINQITDTRLALKCRPFSFLPWPQNCRVNINPPRSLCKSLGYRKWLYHGCFIKAALQLTPNVCFLNTLMEHSADPIVYIHTLSLQDLYWVLWEWATGE